MFLPVFNLTEEELRLLNDKFYFLRSSILKIIQELIERVNASDHLFQLTNDERNQLKLRQQILRECKEHLTSGMEQTTGSVPLPIDAKIKWLEWLKKQHEYLCDENTLSKLLLSAPTAQHDALKTLWESWKKQSTFASHTNQSLVEITTVLLPRLIEHHRKAKLALQRFKDKIPASVSAKFSSYLDHFEESSNSLLKQCRHSMMARLETFARSKQSCSQPILGIMGQLRFHGLIDKKVVEQVSPDFIEPLTPEQFNVFHHEVIREPDLKNRLTNLPWLRAQQKIPTTLLHSETTSYVVPQTMSERIPVRKKSPRWLFRGHNIRASFFKSKGLLLAKLNRPLALMDDVKNTEQFNNVRAIKNFLTDWNNTDNSLLQDIQDTNKKRKKLWTVFQSDSHAFLREWQQTLFTYRMNVLSQQLNIIEHLLAFLETKIQLSESITTIFQHCEHLQQMLDYLERTLTKVLPALASSTNLTIAEIHQTQALLRKHEQLIQASENVLSHSKSIKLFKRLVTSNDLSPPELDYIIGWFDALRQNSSSFQAFCQTHSTEIGLLEKQFKVKLRDISNTTKNKQSIINTFKLLNLIGSDSRKTNIIHYTQKYFLAYLKKLSQCPIDKKQPFDNLLSSMEDILMAIAPDKKFAGETFKTHIETFQNLRKTKGRMTHLQALAEGHAATLASLLLKQRLAKDIDTLETQIEKVMTEKLSSNQNILSLLLRMSQRLVEAKQTRLENIETGLTESDRVLVGLKGQEFIPVKELIELHAFAKQTQKSCISTSHYITQWKHIYQLKQLAEKTFVNNSWTTPFSLGRTPSGRSQLFNKTYWVPPTEKSKHHSLSL